MRLAYPLVRWPMWTCLVLALLVAACAPAAPSPTAPPKPTEAPKPAATAPAQPAEKPAAKPTEAPATKPAEAKPVASPAAKAETKPAASPAAKPAEAKPVASPAASPAFNEQAVADFYRGKTVRMIVGASAGGGFDVYSRAMAKHLPRFIPGNPTMIVENMPGSGTIIAANHLYRVAPRDGTVIGHIAGPIILEQLFKTPGIEYDMGKFRHLAVPVSETFMMIVTKDTGVTRFEETLGPNGKEVIIGSVPGGTVEHGPVLLKELLGSRIKLVSGYQGTAPIRLAIDRGEVQGFFNTWQSVKITNSKEVENGDWRILVQLSDQRIQGAPPAVSGAPTILDITKDEQHRQALLFGTSYPNRFGFDLVAPPEVPPDRAAALEAVFKKTFEDREFMAEAEKANLSMGPLYGAEIQKLVNDMLNMPEGIRSQLQKLMKPAA